jgi:hypothetical protein
MKLAIRPIVIARFIAGVAIVCIAAAAQLQSPSAPAPSAQTPGWKSYSYPADGFSASFPSQPELQTQNVPTSAGTFELRAYLANDGGSALYIGVCDYGSATSKADPDSILNGARDGAVQNVKGKLISSKKITLGENPGMTYEIDSQLLHFTGRMYLVGTVLYQTVAAAPLGKPYASTSKFLDSFQLIAGPPK